MHTARITGLVGPQKFLFRRIRMDDLPLLYKWLTQPFVARWWGHPIEEHEELYWIIKKNEGRGFMACYNAGNKTGRPLGYIQYWQPAKSDRAHVDKLSPDLYGIDIIIGDKAKLGMSLGPKLLKQFCSLLLSAKKVEKITIDPDVNNRRAIKAYIKTGFEPIGILNPIDNEEQPALLMELNEKKLSRYV